jgi:hypothetical protein
MSRTCTTSQMLTPAALAIALLLSSAGPAGAQSAARIDPRFQPWIGCWRTMDTGVGLEELDGEKQPTRACVVPSASIRGTVDIALFYRDSLMSRTTVPAAGAPRPRSIDECEGSEAATWSPDGAQLILRAELSCARGVKRVETGMMAMNGSGQWVQFQHMTVGKNEATTVARFRFEGDSLLPAGLVLGTQRSTRALRLAAGAPITPEAVAGVASLVPPSLAEAWLADFGERFALDSKTLIRLADSGVPSRVIDVMVALANPERFQLGPGRSVSQPIGVASNTMASGVGGGRMNLGVNGRSRCDIFDDFCYGPGGMGAWGFGYRYGMTDPWFLGFNNQFGTRWGGLYGYSPYGFGNGWGNPWGNGWGGGINYGGGPVVIVTNPGAGGAGDGGSVVRGRAVSGGGYTRANPGSEPRGGYSPPSGSMSPGPGGSGGSAGAGVGGGGGDGGRTAKARPPV